VRWIERFKIATSGFGVGEPLRELKAVVVDHKML
jgi:hypothetical protein